MTYINAYYNLHNYFLVFDKTTALLNMIIRSQNDMNFRSGEAMSQGSRPHPLAALSPTPYKSCVFQFLFFCAWLASLARCVPSRPGIVESLLLRGAASVPASMPSIKHAKTRFQELRFGGPSITDPTVQWGP